ncbi:trichohyalin [Cyclospora cayetanensis]|uniref:Trichohyalin n=1 Tax=Cyclospora cayetanensis TaxID=88456 RepID=A0A6P6RTC8_9EIME|nr:trichohyalin [Cyclospora cayetanensis]
MLSQFKNISPCSTGEAAVLKGSCTRIYRLPPSYIGEASIPTGSSHRKPLMIPRQSEASHFLPLQRQQSTVEPIGTAAVTKVAAADTCNVSTVPNQLQTPCASVYEDAKQQELLEPSSMSATLLRPPPQQHEQRQQQSRQLSLQKYEQHSQLKAQNEWEVDSLLPTVSVEYPQHECVTLDPNQQPQFSVKQQLCFDTNQQQQYNQQAESELPEGAREQHDRLAAELLAVEEQLAEKEALLALFDGCLEQQQKLQLAEKLQQLQQKQEQQQQQELLLLRQQQELARQRRQVEAQKREAEGALLLLQQEEEVLKKQQEQQRAAVEEQQKEQQRLKEQQKAFEDTQKEFSEGKKRHQQHQRELGSLHARLQLQGVEPPQKQEHLVQQPKMLQQRQADMRAFIRAQEPRLQQQALQQHLEPQYEMQHQSMDYKGHQLIKSNKALSQQQQKSDLQLQHRNYAPFLSRNRLPPLNSAETTTKGAELPLLHQAQEQLLLQTSRQEELNDSKLPPQGSQWCSCEEFGGEPSMPAETNKSSGILGNAAAAPEPGRESGDSTRLPSAESASAHRNSPEKSSNAMQRELIQRPCEGEGKNTAQESVPRCRSEMPRRASHFSGGEEGQESAQHSSKSACPRRSNSPLVGGSTCPPRLLRSTESQRLREKSLQEHLKSLKAAKRPLNPRGAPKKGSEYLRLQSGDSSRSQGSENRSKMSSWGNMHQGASEASTRNHSKEAPRLRSRTGGSRSEIDPPSAFSGESQSLPPQENLDRMRGCLQRACSRLPNERDGASSSLRRTRQQQLRELLQEQRREINLLLFKKHQLERAASGEGIMSKEQTKSLDPSSRLQIFPREPYLQAEGCTSSAGDFPGCVCGGDHPRTAWGSLDDALAEVHNNHSGLQRWTKVNEGVYFYGDTQVSLSFTNGRLMAQTDAGPYIWNKGARGDILKFIKASDERRMRKEESL